jgi:serine O-acetyltransferase
MFKRLRNDVAAVRERDPAAHSTLEVLLCYPGLHAVIWHRFAHAAWTRGFKLLARLLSNLNRLFTGIEIHPGAVIGDGVFIDHGMGVVIGETAVVGDNVTLYQGVTLGGVSLDPGKRHPTIEDDVIIGAGAAVLGPFTVHRGARIGSNAVVLHEVGAGETMVGIPAKPVSTKPARAARRPCFPAYGTEPGEEDDPLAQEVDAICARMRELEERLAALEGRELEPTEPSSRRIAS